MDATLEGLVEDADTVGGQEQDPLEVLKCAQEDRDKRITLEVLVVAVLEEDVGFI